MTKELLIKFLGDQCTGEELKEVVRWIKNDSLTTTGRYWGLYDWDTFNPEENLAEKERFCSLLDKIHHKINISDYNLSKKKSVELIIGWITRAAAILLIPVLAFLVYILTDKQSETPQYAEMAVDSLEIVAPTGSKTMVEFSDGSEVYLNHGSKIKYPQKFTGNIREVILSGEGYFMVAHDPEKPFIVRTSALNIKALGTTFNVFAYPDEKVVATTLIDGKVVLERETASQDNKSLGTMVPGQHVGYNKETGEILSTKGDVEKYISWKEGKLIFKRDSIVQIVHRLSRWYSVDIEIRDDEVRDYTYTATFIDESLLHILDLLKDAAPIDYRRIPSKRLPDGTFTKQKIIIKKRN
jgi:transmembrane sensor